MKNIFLHFYIKKKNKKNGLFSDNFSKHISIVVFTFLAMVNFLDKFMLKANIFKKHF